MSGRPLYGVLGVGASASDDEIRKAYKRLALQLHPDKNGTDPDAAEKFRAVSDAYGVLGDADRRRVYDHTGVADPQKQQHQQPHGHNPRRVYDHTGVADPQKQQHQQPHGHNPFGDMFGGMFNGGNPFGGGGGGPFGGGGGGGPFGGPNASIDQVTVKVGLADVDSGSKKHVNVTIPDACPACKGEGVADPANDMCTCANCSGSGHVRQQAGPFLIQAACPACHGRGSSIAAGRECKSCGGNKVRDSSKPFVLDIPVGMPSGHRIVFHGAGHYDPNRRARADLVFSLEHALPDDGSVRIDAATGDVHLKVLVTLSELTNGFELTTSPWGKEIRIKSTGYFKPDVPLVVDDMGLARGGTKRSRISIAFEVVYPAAAPGSPDAPDVAFAEAS